MLVEQIDFETNLPCAKIFLKKWLVCNVPLTPIKNWCFL